MIKSAVCNVRGLAVLGIQLTNLHLSKQLSTQLIVLSSQTLILILIFADLERLECDIRMTLSASRVYELYH